jgi:tetratricopeptide (TPR) repeat protein
LAAQHSFESGDYQAAATGYDRLAQSGPRSARFYYNQGNLQLLIGDVPAALLAYRKYCRLAGASSYVVDNLHDAWRQVGDSPGVSAWPSGTRSPLWLLPLSWKLAAGYGIWAIASLLAHFLLFQRLILRLAFNLVLLAALGALLYVDQMSYAQHPFLVIASDDTVFRQGNGLSYPAKVLNGREVRLHAGVEGRLRGERPNGWVQIELPDGQIGWVERRQVLIDN